MKTRLRNPNTPKLWDKILFERNRELLQSPYYNDKIRKVYRILRNTKGRILDIGFGMGNLEKKIIKNKLDLDIYGIDFSKRAVARASRSLKGKYIAASPQKMPFKKSFFDFAVMLDVLEHIPEPESKKTLDEINRVLKINGDFIISVPLNENLRKMNEDGKNFNAHVRQYTPAILEKELIKSGFKVLKKDYIYAFKKYYFLKNIIMKVWPNFRRPNVLVIGSRKIK